MLLTGDLLGAIDVVDARVDVVNVRVDAVDVDNVGMVTPVFSGGPK